MNEELMIEMMKMSNFYGEAHSELLKALTPSVDFLSESELNKIRHLGHSLFALKNHLKYKEIAIHQPERIEETMKKLSLEVDDITQVFENSTKSNQNEIDLLLGALDKINEIHSLQKDQFQTIKELIEPEPLH